MVARPLASGDVLENRRRAVGQRLRDLGGGKRSGAVRRRHDATFPQGLGLVEPVGQQPCPPLLGQCECGLYPPPAGQGCKHSCDRSLRIVLAERGGREGVLAKLVIAQRSAPGLQLLAGGGDAALRLRDVARERGHFRQPHLGQVAVQMILRCDPGQVPGEQLPGGGETALAQREPSAVIGQVSAGLVAAPVGSGGPLGRIELAARFVPVGLAHRDPRQLLARDHLVLQVAGAQGLLQHRLERRLGGGEIAGGDEHQGPVVPRDAGPGALADRVVQRGGPLEVVLRGRQVVHPEREIPSPP